MLRNFFIVNLVLLILAGYIGIKIYKTITSPLALPKISNMKRSEVEIGSKSGINVMTRSYDILTEKDPFNPERRSHIKNPPDSPKTPPVSDRPKLFGTILMGEIRRAILEDPMTKQRKIYGINDSVGGYIVTDIQEEKVILSRNGQEIEIKLREDKGVKPLRLKIPPTRRSQIQRQKRPPRPVPRLRTPQTPSSSGQR